MRISDWSSDVCSSDLPTCGSTTRRPAFIAAAKQFESSGSTAITLIFGFEDLIAAATPASSPPPPTGTNTASRSAHCCTSSRDRKSGGSGKSVSVREELGGRRHIKKKK